MNSFKRMCYLHMQTLTNFPYIEEDFDAITNYELLCKVVEYLNNVIKNENEQNEAINELATAFNELKSYVDNFFDTLDVQEEVNNKLDEMAESGQLDQIIQQYLNSSAIWGFDTVADMKYATNLINGSFAKTLGFYAKDDKGGATYKIRTITEEDTPDDITIITIDNSLVAELVIDTEMNIECFGVYGDDTHDDTTKINLAISKSKNLIFANKTYKITGMINIDNSINIEGNNCKIDYASETNDVIIKIRETNNVNIKDVDIDGNVTWYERTNDESDTTNYNNYRNARENYGGITGIKVQSSSNVTIKNCNISYTGYGIWNQYSSEVIIENCNVTRTISDAFPIYQNCTNILIDKCGASYNGDDAFPIWAKLNSDTTPVPASHNITISNCVAENVNARGYINHGGYNVSFINNKAYKCWIGIQVKSNLPDPSYDVSQDKNTEIIGNTIQMLEDDRYVIYKNYGLFVDGADKVNFTNNFIEWLETPESAECYSIYGRASSNINISNNIIKTMGMHLRHISSNRTSMITIDNNNFETNSNAIVINRTDNVNVSNNICKNTTNYSIGFTDSTYINCSHNKCSNNVYLSGNNYVNITNDQVMNWNDTTRGNTNIKFDGVYSPNGFDGTHTTSFVVGTLVYYNNVLKLLTSTAWVDLNE